MALESEAEIDPVQLRDIFISYFQSCHHFKDYLKNDPNTGITESDLQSFIQKNPTMSLCGDICNATKHLKLDSSGWSGENPKLGEGATVVSKPAEGVSSAGYTVHTDSDNKDAYQLAKDCKKEWDRFLQSNGLDIPS